MHIDMMILNESKRDDLLLPYVEMLKAKGINCNLSILKKYLLRHFVENAGIRNLSLGSNFYLAGVARYYFNGDLTQNKNLAVFDETNSTEDVWDEEICKRLNALILILRNGIVDSVGETFEQPEDFGVLTLPKLLRKYGAKINAALGIKKVKKEKEDTLDRNDSVGNGYTFEIIYNQNEVTKYYRPTSPGAWCITYDTKHYNYYKNHLSIHYIIFKKDGWENVPREKGPEWTSRKPQDEYGCSLIALLQSNETGEPVYITSRWNHGYESGTHCEADHAFTKEEFFAKTGVNDADLQRIFNIWKKDKSLHSQRGGGQNAAEKEKKLRYLRDLKYRQMRINGGENPDSVMITPPRDTEGWSEMDKEDYFNNRRAIIVGNGKTKSSIIDYTIEIEGEECHVLVDKGKILFDSLTQENYRNSYWYKTYDYSDKVAEDGERVSKFKWLNNMIVVRLSGDKYMLYNTRLHQFLDIGGVTKFKYLDNVRTYDSDDAVFYEMKMTNRQIALVNKKTNVPLKLPNGQYWCEEVKYDTRRNYWGREVIPGFVKPFNGYIVMVYDSSARQIFFYNMQERKFDDVDISMFSNPSRLYTKNLNLKTAPNAIIIGNDVWRGPDKFSYLSINAKRMAIGDIEYFGSMSNMGDGYFSIMKNDYETVVDNISIEHSVCWSEEQQSFLLDENGKPFTSINYEFGRSGENNNGHFDLIYFRKSYNVDLDYYDNRKYVYGIYSKKLNSFLVNPKTNTLLFQMGYDGYYNKYDNKIVVYDDDSSPIYNRNNTPTHEYSVDELVAQGYFVKATKPGSATIHPVETSENSRDEVTALAEHNEYDINDIKNMVIETINKIRGVK